MKKSNNISLKNDYAFTQIMKQPKILRGFLSSILHIPPEKIGTIHIKDRHLSKDLLEGKLSILDLYTVVEGTGKINIEMQVLPYTHWDRRSMSYLAKVYTQDLKSGEAYANCVKTIHISILGFNQLADTDYFYSSFHMREDSRHSLYSDQWEIHVIELPKLNSSKVKEEHKKLYQWACFICAEGEEERAMIEKDPYIEEAIRELELLERDPERMDEYLFRQKNLSDYVTQMEYSREEGLKEGEYTKVIDLVQKKMQRGKTEAEIADALEEDPQTIASICRMIRLYPSSSKEEIYKAWQNKPGTD
ncbi:Rpn family recombination-promoting nuclease/putative transposase [Anaerostipes caccae]|uniref:Rpn family recombination-promoting nuclease/putative transposase n=1 Tax=Anaerostipes caccae TaxID=105841 RepID=UPI00101DB1E5|nr:Rpn family recombination-promoting nuclease/putative transposase [Anaerostipes caccae]